MSSTRLLVLGVVRIFQPVHGYDVRRELLTWRAEEWANVNPGSIYHALFLTTHYLDEADALCDRILAVAAVAFGTRTFLRENA